MIFSTLSLYVARRFGAYFAMACGTVFLLVMLIDTVELLRKSANSGATFDQVLLLAALHAPSLILTILPFVTLLSAMACFASMARSSELVVTRAAGVSAWRLTAPTLVAGAVIGAASFALLNPIAAGALQRFETLKARYFDEAASVLSISPQGLWLRQRSAQGQEVIRAWRADRTGAQLWDVSVFRFDHEDRLAARIEAARAVLEPGAWRLHQVRAWRFDPLRRDAPPAETRAANMRIETELTHERILESFSPPQTISFWDMPAFIDMMEAAGFAADRHRMHWHSQLAQPVLMAAMVLLGAAFSMRHARFGGLGWMALSAVLAGLGYFLLSNVAQAFGSIGAIAPVLAAWAPPVAMILIASGLLLHLEDG
ncbi:LPS export ABC transporter permease LptG [Oceanicella actignis]|uniref:LPS export ABC transporter permease LptG n=1 Tax=Oceanicella actignis TaxID=1189325 RepID=UPI0011E6124C|nr:LPS export ABC transporter permease LptG [Oceanicella actignis]TYO90031.1 lipopolysaccharide export system permease protein [Oceanicella actignis]